MRPFAINPALRLRLLDLIRRGQAGTVHSEPESRAVLYHLAAVVLGPASDSGAAAVELAAWYDADIEAEEADFGDGDFEVDFEGIEADVSA